uniref:IS66 family transposase n=2 Tax=Thiolapillus sp. TaxID=2017437 RepID=UPI003AF90FFC
MKTAPDISPNPSAPASLPPADLRRILEEKDRLLAQQQALNAELRKHILLLEEQLRLARLRKFGARSEKLPFQGELFDEAELEVSLKEVEKELAEAEPKKPRKRRTKADGFDENLPRIQVRLTLDEDEKAGANKTFFSKVKEELDIVPAQARVIEYWQEKAVFEQEDGTQQLACAAVRFIPWANAWPASGCWPGSWWPSTPTPCRCTALKAFSSAMAATSAAPRWPTGSSAWTTYSSR